MVVPVHGERTQLDAHARFSQKCQVKNTIIPVNGAVIKLAPGTPETVDHVETGLLAVDLKRIIPSNHRSIIARRKLQYTGTVHISVVLDARGSVLGEPRIDMIGLIDEDDDADIQIQDRLEDHVFFVIDDMTSSAGFDDDAIAEELRRSVRRFVDHVLGIKPKTTIHVLRA